MKSKICSLESWVQSVIFDHFIQNSEFLFLARLTNFPYVVLLIKPYNVVLTFECVDEILKCDHSNKSYEMKVLFFGVVYCAVQGGSNVLVCG